MGLLTRLIQLLTGRPSPQSILRSLQRHRPELQDRCFSMAARSGKPRGLKWQSCDWLETLAIVRDPASGLVTAFCGVNLAFEAIEGGEMEDVDAVATIRDAVAVFHLQDGRWGTGGRILFNMTPELAVSGVAADQELLLLRS